MSIADITGIPRPTVVRKLKYLLKNNYIPIFQYQIQKLNEDLFVGPKY